MKLIETSLVDSTQRHRWEITKKEFDDCQYPRSIGPYYYGVVINDKEREWSIVIYPKGEKEEDKNNVVIYIGMEYDTYDTYYRPSSATKARCNMGIETKAGYWPNDVVDKMYSRGSFDEGREFREDRPERFHLCTTEKLESHFVGDKVILVASFVIYAEGESYRKRMKVADNFVDDVRSMSSHESLSDFTIISGVTKFPCVRILLAARSEYFEGLFRNEPTRKELEIDEEPEVVKAMLEFICKGLIPENIHEKAMDLILLSDMYGLNDLTVACETSLVKNLSPDNAVEILIMLDKVKHLKSDHRQDVLTYIKREADKIVKSKDWKMFVQNYPDLVTEIIIQYNRDTWGQYKYDDDDDDWY